MKGFVRRRVFSALALAAQLSSWAAEVPGWYPSPWHGPGAVIPPVTDLERREDSRAVLISGSALEPNKLEFVFSCWKDMKLSGGYNSAKKWWEIRLGDIDGRKARELPAGTVFDLKANQGRARDEIHSEIRNLAVGPVWILVVSPSTDGFELPKLTEAARRRVRVLALQGADWTGARGKWQGADEAERLALPEFCGLPRAFANALAADGSVAGMDHAIGLVLVPVPFLERALGQIDWRQLSAPMNLDAFLTKAGQTKAGQTSSWLEAGARAAKMANVSDAPGSDGANQREIRALSAYRARNYDLFREGRIPEPFPTHRHSWRYSMGGVDAQTIFAKSGRALVPFRVTGILWGEDQFLQPHRRMP